MLLLAGTLRLGEHRTLDEVHWALLEQLAALGVSISRREVREVRTGRVLLAEPTRESETETLKRLLSPVQALPVPVQVIISDAQTSLLCAIASLWPKVPHQVCQFHALRDASKIIYEQDRQAKVAVRQKLQPKLKQYRTDLANLNTSHLYNWFPASQAD